MEIPSEYVCPITHEIMEEPVCDNEGNTYDKQAIMKWLSRNRTSPISRLPLRIFDLRPNIALKNLICSFIEKNKELFDTLKIREARLKRFDNSSQSSTTDVILPSEISQSIQSVREPDPIIQDTLISDDTIDVGNSSMLSGESSHDVMVTLDLDLNLDIRNRNSHRSYDIYFDEIHTCIVPECRAIGIPGIEPICKLHKCCAIEIYGNGQESININKSMLENISEISKRRRLVDHIGVDGGKCKFDNCDGRCKILRRDRRTSGDTCIKHAHFMEFLVWSNITDNRHRKYCIWSENSKENNSNTCIIDNCNNTEECLNLCRKCFTKYTMIETDSHIPELSHRDRILEIPRYNSDLNLIDKWCLSADAMYS